VGRRADRDDGGRVIFNAEIDRALSESVDLDGEVGHGT
jgi:hypothetical protein